MKLFLLWKSSNSNKAYARILIMQIKRWALLNNENFVLAWISPIRHISQTAEKYGFRAICPHIKKISWFLDSSEQYYFVTPLQWWSMFRLKQQWTRLIYLLISWNSNLFQLCLISRVKTKIVSKKLSCDFRHNLTFEIKNSDKRCSLLPTRSMWEKMIRSTEFTLLIRIQN